MDLRLALFDTAAQHRLDALATTRLEHLAGLHTPPRQLLPRLAQGLAVAAAALGGLGLVFWVAANWSDLGRTGRFALLQGTVVLTALGAAGLPAARVPLSLVAWLATGGLLAYIGQTYQTGADPWQLFALWAALTLPLALGGRSDVLWAPWTLVALTGVALWVQAHTGHRWRTEPDDLAAHALGWAAALGVAALVSPPLARRTRAGVWAWRTALVLTVVLVGAGALSGLFHSPVAPHFAAGLLLMAMLAAALATSAWFDLMGLSAAALGLNTLLIAGLARWLFDHGGGDPIGRLLLIGLAAAGLLAGTVSLILRLARRPSPRAAQGVTP